MAFSLTQRIVTLSARDDGGTRGEISVNIPTGASYAAANAFAVTFAARVQALSTASVDRYTITTTAYDSAAAPATAAHDGAALIFRAGVPADESRWLAFIPSVNPSNYVTTGTYAGVAIDTAIPAVTTLINLYLIGDGTLVPVSQFGSLDIAALLAAYRQTR